MLFILTAVCCFCCVIPCTLSATISPSFAWRQQQVSSEPLLRFPFADFLANPCGFMGSSSNSMSPALSNWPGMVTEPPASQREDTEPSQPPPPLRTLDNNVSLIQQTRDFLIPIRDRFIIARNYTAEERSVMAMELRLAVMEAKHLVRHIYPPTALHYCDGIQPQSLPQESQLLSSSGEIRLDEVYRGLMASAAHMHLMIRDAYDSARFCPNENRAQHQNIRQLTGKVETLMCLILHSAAGPEDYDSLNFYRMAHSVLQTTVHRYFDCSAREIRGCLVVRYADRILSAVQSLSNNQQQVAQTSSGH